MKTILSPATTLHKSILAAGAGLLLLAAACASPTAPTTSNAAALRTNTTPTTHNACGVYAGSGQC